MKRLVLVAIVMSVSFAAWAASSKEHPLIRPYPGSVLSESVSKYSKFNAHKYLVKNLDTGKDEWREIKGEYWRLLYAVKKPDGSVVKDISTVEFFENYKAAAVEKGGRVVFDGPVGITFMLPREDGGITYCNVSVAAGRGEQLLTIVDERPFKKSLTFGPTEMKAALDKDGRVMLYGILFDLDKATLKPESTKQLQHVLTLLSQHADLKLEVQGHTDSQGSDEHNLELSQRRAATVVAYLGLFGVAPERLTPKGYGESAPVESNDTEEGRAKNRRVELVKR
jgi:OmpA-OmpF porin, OOP family